MKSKRNLFPIATKSKKHQHLYNFMEGREKERQRETKSEKERQRVGKRDKEREIERKRE